MNSFQSTVSVNRELDISCAVLVLHCSHSSKMSCLKCWRIAKEHRTSRPQKKINRIINEELNEELKKAKKKTRYELKILLLGTGESGKSTFVKQMRIIHNKDYSEEERREFTHYVYHNIVIAIQTIIKAMESLNIKYANDQNVQNAEFLSSLYVDSNTSPLNEMNDQLVNAIKNLWFDSGVQKCYNRRNQYLLSDSAKYYFDSIDRLAATEYVPSREDILRVRIPTTGINEYTFELSAVRFRVIDVGGQR